MASSLLDCDSRISRDEAKMIVAKGPGPTTDQLPENRGPTNYGMKYVHITVQATRTWTGPISMS